MTRVGVWLVGFLAIGTPSSAQSLVDLARESEARRRTMPSASPSIVLGSSAFQDIALSDALFTQYAQTQEALARMLLGDPVRRERLALRRRAFQPGTDAAPLYEGEPDLQAAIVAMGLTPQALEDIAWTVTRAYEESPATTSPVRLANRAWVIRNNARVLELDERVQYIRAGFRVAPVD